MRSTWRLIGPVAVSAVLWLAGCDSSPMGREWFKRESVQRARSAPLLPGESVDPALPEEEPDILPQTHLAAGRLHESQGRLQRALEQYQLAVQAKPDMIEALNALGIVQTRLGRYAEAGETFRRAIAIAPDQAYLHNNLGFSLMSQLKWKEAEAELCRALELRPDFVRARVNLAMTLAQQDRFEEAQAAFLAVLRPEDAHYNMGLMYQSRRRFAEAARAFKTALELNPKMVAAQKRLEVLPPDIAREATRESQATASPMPVGIQAETAADRIDQPHTQPAADTPAAAGNGFSPPSPEPSDTETLGPVFEDEPLGFERQLEDLWLTSLWESGPMLAAAGLPGR